MEEGVPGQHSHAKFYQCCGLKIWTYSPQNCEKW